MGVEKRIFDSLVGFVTERLFEYRSMAMGV